MAQATGELDFLQKQCMELTTRGSAIARIAGQNAKKHSDVFEERTPIWVFEEDVSAKVLSPPKVP